MALIKCGECGSKVSNKAAACPKCGAPVDKNQKKKKKKLGIGKILIILLVAPFVLVALLPDTDNDSSPKKTSVSTPLHEPLPEKAKPAPEKSELAEIVANNFSLEADFEGGILGLAVETDLPDFAGVTVTVRRTYKQKGNLSDYSIDYFTERGTVAEWRSPREIRIDNAQWNSDLAKKQKEMSRVGMGFDVASVSDKITVSMVVPINQMDPRFAKGNGNLTGTAVRTTGVRVVKDEVSIAYPINAKITERAQASLDPLNLTIGQVYLVSRSTPLMPSPNSSDPIATLEKAQKIAAGGGFQVIDVQQQDGKPWYHVALLNTKTDEVVSGWVSSTALIGRQLDTP